MVMPKMYENILNIWDVDSFAVQQEQPILLTMNCLNGYFAFPFFNAMSEELLKAEDKGAIAAFSPSGLSLNTPAHMFHSALLAFANASLAVLLSGEMLGP